MTDEGLEQLKLELGQSHDFAVDSDLAGRPVDLEVGVAVGGRLARRRHGSALAATKQRLNPCP